MIIKNLTDERQTLQLKPLVGEDRIYEVTIEPCGSTDVEMMAITNQKDLAGKIQIGEIASAPAEKIVEPVVEAPAKEVVAEVAPAVNEHKFICDICGEEFASARGLANHKNKAHAE